MKKDCLRLIAIVAVLVVSTSLLFGLALCSAQHDWRAVSRLNRPVPMSSVPSLSESIDPRPSRASEDQTDNATAVTSGGAVRASFTVVSQPVEHPEETVTAESQTMASMQAQPAAPVHQQSGGPDLILVASIAACSVSVAALSGFALLRLRAKART